jgi:hypothetical protein
MRGCPEWLWCQRCERVWRRADWLACSGWCPGSWPSCDGAMFWDGWWWFEVRRFCPYYPVVPKSGVRYPLWLGRGLVPSIEGEVENGS